MTPRVTASAVGPASVLTSPAGASMGDSITMMPAFALAGIDIDGPQKPGGERTADLRCAF